MSDPSETTLLTTSIFNPALLRKDDLIRGFVARQDLLERILDDLHRAERGTPPQHQLLLGQRGLGKTMLLRRLAFAIEDDPRLSAQWIPLVFPEEQYNIKNLGDLWLNCADALSDALDRMGNSAAAEHLDKQVERMLPDTHQPSTRALRILIDEADRLGRGLVLLLDNLDIVLDRLSKDEEWEFRHVISSEHRLYFVGASSRALEALYEHGRAFYDYFHVHELKGLSDDETFALLRKLALEANNVHVQELLNEKPSRVRALRALTGGNPRTLVLLYRVLAEGPEGDVQRDIEQLLDLYTPLYKARFEEMAPQAQQVVDAMAIHWDPVTAAELAREMAPLSVNQISAQLNRLEDIGVVEKTAWFGEKKAAFQIAERFFNIWYLMRASRRVRRRLLWLVRFFEAWFEREELAEQARRYLSRDPKSVGSARYAEMALAYSQMVNDRYLRRSLESAGLRAALDVKVSDSIDFSDLPSELQGQKERMERLRGLRDRLSQMRFEGIEEQELWRVLGGSPHYSLDQKVALVDKLPTLSPPAVRELYAELKRSEQQLMQFRPDSSDVKILYESLADGEIADAFDVEGALFVARRRRCHALPMMALLSKSIPFLSPRPQTSDELRSCEKAIRDLGNESGYEAVAAWTLGIFLADRVKRYDEADREFARAIKLGTNDSTIWKFRGTLLANNLERYDEAEQAFRHAIELDPQSPDSWQCLGKLLAKAEVKRYDEAERAFRRAIELAPQSADSWQNLGRFLADEDPKRYGEAEQALRRAIEIDPQSAHYWHDLGMFLESKLERYDEAEGAFRRAISLEPQSPLSWMGIGLALAGANKYEEAVQAFRTGVEINPNSAHLWTIFGLVLTTEPLKRFEEAEQAFRRAIEIDPEFEDSWSSLGDLLKDDLNRYQEAEKSYRRAIEINPKNADVWNSLGDLLEEHLNRFEEAEYAYGRALKIDPLLPLTWYSLAKLIKRNPNRQAESLDAYRRGIEADSEDERKTSLLIDSFLPFARSLGQGPQRRVALEVVTRICDALPDNVDVQFLYAGLLTLDDQWDRARALLETLSEKEIENPDVWAFTVVVQAGHLTDAIAILEKTGADQRWRPLCEALRAVQAESRDYLRRVAPEVRGIAEQILSEIAPSLEVPKSIGST